MEKEKHTKDTFLNLLIKSKTMKETQITTVEETINMAKLFSESGMFSDTKQMAQAFVKIQAGKEMGINAFAAMTGINIIMGKPTLGAGLIASCVKGSGKYDYKVKEMSDSKCSIDFFEGKTFLGNSTFSIEDAKKQGTKNLDKFPKNMLFARAISNGQKWFCPDVFQMPVYVPEEMNQETTEDIPHEEIKNEEPEQENKPLKTQTTPMQQAIKEMQDTESVDDLKAIWTKYKVFQKDADFLDAKDKRKLQLELQ